MKKLRKTLSLLLCTLMILTQLVVVSVVDAAAAEGVTGATQVTTESIYLNGKDTGVTHTQMLLPQGSKYALNSDGVLNVAEISAGSDAFLKVINHGEYNWGMATVGDAAVAYNQANTNSTVLAAINGSPWLMATTDYDGDHVTATGPAVKGGAGKSMSMGFMMIDGEIWNTNWFSDENKMDNKYYTDWSSSGQSCFYVLKDGTYAIGDAPNLALMVVNNETNKKIIANGINRLPAPNSIVIYNKRAYSESLAYEDAYEIYVKCDSTAFKVDDSVTGTITHIFESGDTSERPDIDENTVVISSRGTSQTRLKNGGFQVGGEVSVTVSNKTGHAENAVQIIGGFFTLMENGRLTGQQDNAGSYPCSIIGIKEDGSAILINITSSLDKKYHGSRHMDLPTLCKELGCVDALLFDGGGSSTFVTLEEGTYIRRNGCSDGQPRASGNSLAIVYEYEGDDVDGTYDSASLIGLLDGEQNDNRPVGYVAPPEVFDENADVLGYPATNISYAASIDWINGVGPNGDSTTPYTDLASYLNATSGDTKDAVADGKALTTDDNYLLSVSGWAQTAGGQTKYYWSTDRYSWYECVNGSYDAATDAITAAAGAVAGLGTLSAENGRFANIAADLSAYEGQTVNLYFAVADADGKPVNILTVNELTVSHKHIYDNGCDADCNRCSESREELTHNEVAEEDKAATCTQDGLQGKTVCADCQTVLNEGTVIPATGHVYDADCDGDCNSCGETHTAGEHTDGDGDRKCDACGADVADEVMSTASTTEPASDGCGSVIGLSAVTVLLTLAGALCLKKKED